MTVEEVAAALGVGAEHTRRLIRAGDLPARLKLGSTRLGYRITREDLAAYLRAKGEEDMARGIEEGTLARSV